MPDTVENDEIASIDDAITNLGNVSANLNDVEESLEEKDLQGALLALDDEIKTLLLIKNWIDQAMELGEKV